MGKTLIKNGHILTMDADDTRCTGDILIDGERIEKIASCIDERADRVIDATGGLVLPGFVQSHIHLCQTLFRGQADDQPLLDWLNTMTDLESRHTPETLYASARLGLAEIIKSGTTAIIDMGTVHHQDSVFTAMDESGIRGQSGKAMMDLTENLPPALRETTEDSMSESMDLLHRWNGKAGGRIRYGFAPRWQLWNTDGLLREIKTESDRHDVGVHGHAGEIQYEVPAMLHQRGRRNLKYLEHIGLVGPRVQMAHCIWLDDDELDVLSETGTHVMHCPCCNLKLGSGIARIPEMLARGISVSLGSDGAPSNNNLDMFIEMRVASLIHKYRLGAEALPAREVLGMATKGGAAALGLSDQIGSLEPEKKADLIILDDGGVHAAPIMDFELDDPVERIVSAFQSASVRTSIINGQIVMDNRKLVCMDEEDVIEKARVALRTLHEAAS
jgi:cytosine/adenosine deaminase-related metal-dependent hydrolase|tara:strand:+ start:3003 stop:4334 length:1332 start_codon:yes stop_codon:yes gene_type:complete